MSLDHILLGILQQPESGYSLKQSFDNVFSHFWTAEISQIYRHLKNLEKRGYLRSWEEASPKGPPKRLYQRTPQGLAALREWLEAGPKLADRRVPYLSQVCFLAEHPDAQARVQFFEKLKEHFQARLRVLEDINAVVREVHDESFPNGLPVEEVCGQLTLNHGLHRARAMLVWCEESLAILRRGDGLHSDDVQTALAGGQAHQAGAANDLESDQTN